MSKRKRLIFTAMAVALVGIVTGFLPGCASTPTSTPTSTQTANEVIIRGRALLPDPIIVPVGTTVTWTNREFDVHTITSDDNLFNADLALNDSFSYTFTEPGTYSYFLTPHNADEMFDGKVIVE